MGRTVARFMGTILFPEARGRGGKIPGRGRGALSPDQNGTPIVKRKSRVLSKSSRRNACPR